MFILHFILLLPVLNLFLITFNIECMVVFQPVVSLFVLDHAFAPWVLYDYT